VLGRRADVRLELCAGVPVWEVVWCGPPDGSKQFRRILLTGIIIIVDTCSSSVGRYGFIKICRRI
jgi:hypothetical protein